MAQEVESLEIVYAMLDTGVADAVMGNHEYNALAYATVDETAMQHQEQHYSPCIYAVTMRPIPASTKPS